MTQKRYTEIPRRFKSIASDDPYVAGSEDIDAGNGKNQKQLNEETDERIATEVGRAQQAESTLEGKISAEKTRAEGVEGGLNNRLQTVEQLATISVGGGDIGIGTAADFESDDPEDLAKVPTVGAMLGGANDGVYDISARHSGATYADLAAALGENGANVPAGVRRGGMSVKFVQSSDNKYVQFRLRANAFTTDITQWQGVDDEPTAGSDNLVKSDGVANEIYNNISQNDIEAQLGWFVNYENGVKATSVYNSHCIYEFSNRKYKKVRVRTNVYDNTKAIIAFYNGSSYMKSDSVQSDTSKNGNTNNYQYEAIVPSECTKIIVYLNTDSGTPAFIASNNRMDIVEDEINTIKPQLNEVTIKTNSNTERISDLEIVAEKVADDLYHEKTEEDFDRIEGRTIRYDDGQVEGSVYNSNIIYIIPNNGYTKVRVRTNVYFNTYAVIAFNSPNGYMKSYSVQSDTSKNSDTNNYQYEASVPEGCTQIKIYSNTDNNNAAFIIETEEIESIHNTINVLSKKTFRERGIISVAHQGYSLIPDEYWGNSRLSSYDGAVLHGFDAGECDVQFTLDEEIVCCHDASFVDKNTEERIVIAEHTLAELKTYNYYGETIASLDEVVGKCKVLGLKLQIDHTPSADSPYWQKMFDIVDKYQMADRILWTCDPIESLEVITNWYPKCSICKNVTPSNIASVEQLNSFKTNLNTVIGMFSYTNTTIADVIEMNKLLTNGVKTVVFTIDDIEIYKQWLPYVSLITSNKISEPMTW